MATTTILDQLRGKPFCQVGDFTTIYRRGSLLAFILIVGISFAIDMLKDVFGLGITVGLCMFAILFASAMAVRFELPDGSEI